MSDSQVMCLILMFVVGLFSCPMTANSWRGLSKAKRVFLVAWIALWLGPPLCFIWMKGVLG